MLELLPWLAALLLPVAFGAAVGRWWAVVVPLALIALWAMVGGSKSDSHGEVDWQFFGTLVGPPLCGLVAWGVGARKLGARKELERRDRAAYLFFGSAVTLVVIPLTAYAILGLVTEAFGAS